MNNEVAVLTWILLIIAIILEVFGTISMKLSDGFTKVGPIVAMLVFYAMGLSLLAYVIRSIDISIAYAVWSGLGTALIAIIGILWFKETATMIKIVSISLIVIGVVGLNLGVGSS